MAGPERLLVESCVAYHKVNKFYICHKHDHSS